VRYRPASLQQDAFQPSTAPVVTAPISPRAMLGWGQTAPGGHCKAPPAQVLPWVGYWARTGRRWAGKMLLHVGVQGARAPPLPGAVISYGTDSSLGKQANPESERS